ncbi:hypothetical protein ACSLO8_24715, partial [Escherichia coli]
MNDEMKGKSGKVKVMYVRSDDDSDKRTHNPRTGKGGGRLYAHSLEHIIPGFADSAPVERLITHEKLAFMTEKSAMTM